MENTAGWFPVAFSVFFFFFLIQSSAFFFRLAFIQGKKPVYPVISPIDGGEIRNGHMSLSTAKSESESKTIINLGKT